MTTQSKCSEREALVALVYDDGDVAERQRLETHVAACAACAQEAEQLRATHVAMAAWTLPAPDVPIVDRLGSDVRPWRLVERGKPESAATGRGPRRVFSTRWMQVAAAVLVFGVTAAVANVEIELGSGGIVVRTGWGRSRADAATSETKLGPTTQLGSATPATPNVVADRPASAAGTDSTLISGESPWRADLASLERRLRTEFSGHVMAPASNRLGMQTSQPLQAMSDAPLVRRVQQMIDESARLQQRELALRIAQVVRDFDLQRRVDLARIEQGFGRLEGVTGAEIARQQQVLNNLVRVSQRQ